MRIAALLVGALLLTACGSEGERQAGARVAVAESISAVEYERERTRCTGNPAPWFVERDADVFICAARLQGGGCDWYRATLKNAGWQVELERRNADCILPS